MTHSERKDILERGLSSPFWQLLRAHIDEEWGAGGKRFERALVELADRNDDDATLVRQMQQIAVCRREILKLLDWPHEELRRAKEQEHEAEPDPTRAVTDPDVLVGMSRRGGL